MKMESKSLALALTLALGAAPLFAADKLNDAQIAQVVVTANQIDIENGHIALDRSKTSQVDEFANLMVKDHTAVNNNAEGLVKKLGVTPEASKTSESLRKDADKEQTKLKGLSGKDFDKAYLKNEVAYHKQVIAALDKTLIPDAQNAELKKTLVDVKPAFQAHLEHAEKTLAELDKH
jgi:putative membrane protein